MPGAASFSVNLSSLCLYIHHLCVSIIAVSEAVVYHLRNSWLTPHLHFILLPGSYPLSEICHTAMCADLSRAINYFLCTAWHLLGNIFYHGGGSVNIQTAERKEHNAQH